jgi:hypothetical protein
MLPVVLNCPILIATSVWFGLVYGALRHFQQYFSYIKAASLLVEESGVL